MSVTTEKSLKLATLCTILVLSWFTPQMAMAEGKLLKFCYDPYPPYTLGTAGTPDGGLKVNLLEAVVDQINGLDASVTLMPWKRCQVEARLGNVDGILPLFKNDERSEYLEFSIGTFPQLSTFWYNVEKHPNGIEWSGKFEDISHLKLGMLNGGHINEDMETEFERKSGIQRARDMDILVALLQKQRVDLIAIDDNVGRFVIEQKKLSYTLVPVKVPISMRQSFFGFSKVSGANKYRNQFDEVIKRLEQDGTIEKIRLNAQ